MAGDVFADAVMAQLLELHSSILAEHKRALDAPSSQKQEPLAAESGAAHGADTAGQTVDSMARRLSAGSSSAARPMGRRSSRVSAIREFVMHGYWRVENAMGPTTSFGRRSSALKNEYATAAYFNSRAVRSDTRLDEEANKCCSGLVSHPNSRKRLVWGVFALLFICYDIAVLPLQVFDVEETTFLAVMGWITLCYWTLDLPGSFFVGFHTLGGSLVMSVRAISRRYLATWFPLDIFLVTIDWMLVFVAEATAAGSNGTRYESIGLARLGKTMRIFRLLRLLRLMRLAKLPKYFVQIEEHIQSESVIVFIGILKLTACILVINHLFACCWFAIGSISGDQQSWVRFYAFDDAEILYQYTTSLHWSLTQFTPASMEVFPRNTWERSFALVVLVFALITFSSFVSSITNAMTHLRNLNSEYVKQFVQLGRYLRYHKISVPVAVRVRRHLARIIVERQQQLEESEVVLLKFLSEPLLMDLRLEVFRPLLDHHPFFQRYCDANFVAVRKLCHTAIIEFSLAAGDLLFSPGETCDRMFFVKSGTMRYSIENSPGSPKNFQESWEGPGDPDEGGGGDVGGEDTPVRENAWFCEACLWTPWRHLGHMHAFTGSGLVALEAVKFCEVAQKFRSCEIQPARYGEIFVRHLNSSGLHELTDLHCESFDYATAVATSCELLRFGSEVLSSAQSVDSTDTFISSMAEPHTPHTNALSTLKESL